MTWLFVLGIVTMLLIFIVGILKPNDGKFPFVGMIIFVLAFIAAVAPFVVDNIAIIKDVFNSGEVTLKGYLLYLIDTFLFPGIEIFIALVIAVTVLPALPEFISNICRRIVKIKNGTDEINQKIQKIPRIIECSWSDAVTKDGVVVECSCKIEIQVDDVQKYQDNKMPDDPYGPVFDTAGAVIEKRIAELTHKQLMKKLEKTQGLGIKLQHSDVLKIEETANCGVKILNARYFLVNKKV